MNGHSMSNPILDADGNVDMDASRRVEVKFRLKDEEMIQELTKIMSSQEEDTPSSESSETAAKTETETQTETAAQ